MTPSNPRQKGQHDPLSLRELAARQLTGDRIIHANIPEELREFALDAHQRAFVEAFRSANAAQLRLKRMNKAEIENHLAALNQLSRMAGGTDQQNSFVLRWIKDVKAELKDRQDVETVVEDFMRAHYPSAKK